MTRLIMGLVLVTALMSACNASSPFDVADSDRTLAPAQECNTDTQIC